MKPLFLLPLMLVAACGSSGGQDACQPGDSQPCTCAGGAEGDQDCLADGSGWEACVCACVPDCQGIECGPDRVCGENCGTCINQCTGLEEEPLCSNGTCLEVCCPLTCGDLSATCGSPDDGCGNLLVCGDCGQHQYCDPSLFVCQEGPVFGASPIPCGLAADQEACASTLSWDTSDSGWTQVRADGEFFACTPPGVHSQSTGEVLGVQPATWTVHPTVPESEGGCAPDAPVGHAVATLELFGAPACSLDDEPMLSVGADFFSIIANEINSANNPGQVADYMAQAHVQAVRRSVKWSNIEAEPGVFTWGPHDRVILEAMGGRDLPVVATLTYTPDWASTWKPGNEGEPRAYPPGDLNDWAAFVDAAVLRYRDQVVHWEVWQEPDVLLSFRGTPADYVALLNVAYPIIKARDPAAMVWAPQVIIDKSPDAYAFLEAVVQAGQFDGISVHCFHDTVAEMVTGIENLQSWLDDHNVDAPIAVTAAQIWGVAVAGADHCPYLDATDEEMAATLQDIYVCLANAGVQSMHWFKTTDILGDCDGDGSKEQWDTSGVLSTEENGGAYTYSPKPAYPIFQRIGESILHRPD